MLRALCRLWQVDSADGRVMAVARALGSDVPVCVPARACFMTGAGEILEPCPALPAADLVLANPGVPVPTRDVFAARTGSFAPPGRFAKAPADTAALAEILAGRHNGLQEPAIGVAPAIQAVLDELAASPGCLLPRMLGSGATCFGLFASAAEARATASELKIRHPGWWISSCRLHDLPRQDA
jgi:4-diphosphocytidyl-2-C-methyl-D-erythritol kinase